MTNTDDLTHDHLRALLAELDAVHLDLGQAVAERTFTEGVLKAERVKVVDALWAAVGVPPEVPHGGKTLDEMLVYAKAAFATERAALIEVIDAVGKLAHAMGAEWSDADVPHAIEVLSRALRETERHRATQTELVQLEAEVAALEAWVKGAGSLGDGRVAAAVLKYAHDHEERVWTTAAEKHRKVLEGITDAALRGKAKLDAVAACAEMRAALQAALDDGATPPGVVHLAYCALARTDLGRGMVAVPRETLERARKALGSHETCGVDFYMAAVADLDALLKKGGG